MIDEGGHVHGELHINGQGVTATGLTTGTTYRFVAALNYTFSGRLDETGTFTETFIVATGHIAPGPDNNTLIRERYHITVNANGETTVEFEGFEINCNG